MGTWLLVMNLAYDVLHYSTNSATNGLGTAELVSLTIGARR